MICLDVPVVVGLLFGTEVGQEVARRVAIPGTTIHAPALLDAERYTHEPLVSRIWELRHNLTAYDATYVALAETLEATLLTGDVGMAKTASDLSLAKVVLV